MRTWMERWSAWKALVKRAHRRETQEKRAFRKITEGGQKSPSAKHMHTVNSFISLITHSHSSGSGRSCVVRYVHSCPIPHQLTHIHHPSTNAQRATQTRATVCRKYLLGYKLNPCGSLMMMMLLQANRPAGQLLLLVASQPKATRHRIQQWTIVWNRCLTFGAERHRQSVYRKWFYFLGRMCACKTKHTNRNVTC